jgi:hypothetical protein
LLRVSYYHQRERRQKKWFALVYSAISGKSFRVLPSVKKKTRRRRRRRRRRFPFFAGGLATEGEGQVGRRTRDVFL